MIRECVGGMRLGGFWIKWIQNLRIALANLSEFHPMMRDSYRLRGGSTLMWREQASKALSMFSM